MSHYMLTVGLDGLAHSSDLSGVFPPIPVWLSYKLFGMISQTASFRLSGASMPSSAPAEASSSSSFSAPSSGFMGASDSFELKSKGGLSDVSSWLRGRVQPLQVVLACEGLALGWVDVPFDALCGPITEWREGSGAVAGLSDRDDAEATFPGAEVAGSFPLNVDPQLTGSILEAWPSSRSPSHVSTSPQASSSAIALLAQELLPHCPRVTALLRQGAHQEAGEELAQYLACMLPSSLSIILTLQTTPASVESSSTSQSGGGGGREGTRGMVHPATTQDAAVSREVRSGPFEIPLNGATSASPTTIATTTSASSGLLHLTPLALSFSAVGLALPLPSIVVGEEGGESAVAGNTMTGTGTVGDDFTTPPPLTTDGGKNNELAAVAKAALAEVVQALAGGNARTHMKGVLQYEGIFRPFELFNKGSLVTRRDDDDEQEQVLSEEVGWEFSSCSSTVVSNSEDAGGQSSDGASSSSQGLIRVSAHGGTASAQDELEGGLFGGGRTAAPFALFHFPTAFVESQGKESYGQQRHPIPIDAFGSVTLTLLGTVATTIAEGPGLVPSSSSSSPSAVAARTPSLLRFQATATADAASICAVASSISSSGSGGAQDFAAFQRCSSAVLMLPLQLTSLCVLPAGRSTSELHGKENNAASSPAPALIPSVTVDESDWIELLSLLNDPEGVEAAAVEGVGSVSLRVQLPSSLTEEPVASSSPPQQSTTGTTALPAGSKQRKGHSRNNGKQGADEGAALFRNADADDASHEITGDDGTMPLEAADEQASSLYSNMVRMSGSHGVTDGNRRNSDTTRSNSGDSGAVQASSSTSNAAIGTGSVSATSSKLPNLAQSRKHKAAAMHEQLARVHAALPLWSSLTPMPKTANAASAFSIAAAATASPFYWRKAHNFRLTVDVRSISLLAPPHHPGSSTAAAASTDTPASSSYDTIHVQFRYEALSAALALTALAAAAAAAGSGTPSTAASSSSAPASEFVLHPSLPPLLTATSHPPVAVAAHETESVVGERLLPNAHATALFQLPPSDLATLLRAFPVGIHAFDSTAERHTPAPSAGATGSPSLHEQQQCLATAALDMSPLFPFSFKGAEATVVGRSRTHTLYRCPLTGASYATLASYVAANATSTSTTASDSPTPPPPTIVRIIDMRLPLLTPAAVSSASSGAISPFSSSSSSNSSAASSATVTSLESRGSVRVLAYLEDFGEAGAAEEGSTQQTEETNTPPQQSSTAAGITTEAIQQYLESQWTRGVGAATAFPPSNSDAFSHTFPKFTTPAAPISVSFAPSSGSADEDVEHEEELEDRSSSESSSSQQRRRRQQDPPSGSSSVVASAYHLSDDSSASSSSLSLRSTLDPLLVALTAREESALAAWRATKEREWLQAKTAIEEGWRKSTESAFAAKVAELERAWADREVERQSSLAGAQEAVARVEARLRRLLSAAEAKERELERTKAECEAAAEAKMHELNALAKRLREDAEHSASLLRAKEEAQAARAAATVGELASLRSQYTALLREHETTLLSLARGPDAALRDAISALQAERGGMERRLQESAAAAERERQAKEEARMQVLRLAKEVARMREAEKAREAADMSRLRVAYLATEERYALEGDRAALRSIRRQVDDLRSEQQGATSAAAASPTSMQHTPSTDAPFINTLHRKDAAASSYYDATAPPSLPTPSTPSDAPPVVSASRGSVPKTLPSLSLLSSSRREDTTAAAAAANQDPAKREMERLRSERKMLVTSSPKVYSASHPAIVAIDKRLVQLTTAHAAAATMAAQALVHSE